MNKKPTLFYINLLVKFILFLFFFIAIVFQPEHLEGKGMVFRAPFFLASAVVIPIIAKVKGWKEYPYDADIFVVMPFLLDTFGNMFYLFDAVWFYDDLIHCINWIFLVLAYHSFRFRKINDTRDALLLGMGFGALSIIAWELMEWLISVDGLGTVGNLSLSYVDTVGDLFTSTVGGIIGSIIGVKTLGKKNKLVPLK